MKKIVEDLKIVEAGKAKLEELRAENAKLKAEFAEKRAEVVNGLKKLGVTEAEAKIMIENFEAKDVAELVAWILEGLKKSGTEPEILEELKKSWSEPEFLEELEKLLAN